jgi:hypothetical protein
MATFVALLIFLACNEGIVESDGSVVSTKATPVSQKGA